VQQERIGKETFGLGGQGHIRSSSRAEVVSTTCLVSSTLLC
jgi:hypothetical protein